MSISLKDINRPALVLVFVANIALYCAVFSWFDIAQFYELMKNHESYLPGTFLVLIVGILNSQLDHKTKARLVFWRWSHPLPGSYAFTEIINTDDRINPTALRAIQDPLPTDPTEQNHLWFKWYRELQNEPSISQAHREYLFARDWAGLVTLFGIVMSPFAFWQMEQMQAFTFLAIIAIQYFVVRWSARNHGRRFVASVLAYKSSI